jgi:hypothetical protein
MQSCSNAAMHDVSIHTASPRSLSAPCGCRALATGSKPSCATRFESNRFSPYVSFTEFSTLAEVFVLKNSFVVIIETSSKQYHHRYILVDIIIIVIMMIIVMIIIIIIILVPPVLARMCA